jgi:hypothetical protein
MCELLALNCQEGLRAMYMAKKKPGEEDGGVEGDVFYHRFLGVLPVKQEGPKAIMIERNWSTYPCLGSL